MSDLHRLASTVRAELARRRIRQNAVAKSLGMSQTAVSRRLNGETEFTVSELVAIAALLDLPVAALLDGRATDLAPTG